jgi:hypothetical protein
MSLRLRVASVAVSTLPGLRAGWRRDMRGRRFGTGGTKGVSIRVRLFLEQTRVHVDILAP